MEYVSQDGFSPLAERGASNVSTLKPWDVATVAALKAIETIDGAAATATTRPRYMRIPQGRQERVRSLNGRLFAWHPTSELDGDDQLVIIPDDRNSDVDTALAADLPGRWLAVPGQTVDLALAFTYATADGATLYTVPTGANLLILSSYWEVTTGFTGGSSSAIGLASDQTGHTTAGDLLGGSGGDVAATLVAGDYIEGTLGADLTNPIVLKATKLVTFERITSAFTAGAGNAHIVAVVLSNDGA
jgi:hypothetical protein